jgi:hypothetical protein
VGSENGPDIKPVDYFLEDGGPCLGGNLVDGFGQPAILLRAGPQAPHPVDLLSGVGEVEVEREGTHQVRGLLDGQGAEEFADLGDDVVRAPRAGGIGTAAGGFLGFLGEEADLLHEVKELWPVLADQGFTQEGGNAADVCPQFGGKI